MANLPDNFSQRAFDARYTYTLPNSPEAGRIAELDAILAKTRELHALLTDPEFDALRDHLDEHIRTIPHMVQRVRDTAYCEAA